MVLTMPVLTLRYDSICELERNICEITESNSESETVSDDHDKESESSDNESPFCDTDNTVMTSRKTCPCYVYPYGEILCRYLTCNSVYCR